MQLLYISRVSVNVHTKQNVICGFNWDMIVNLWNFSMPISWKFHTQKSLHIMVGKKTLSNGYDGGKHLVNKWSQMEMIRLFLAAHKNVVTHIITL